MTIKNFSLAKKSPGIYKVPSIYKDYLVSSEFRDLDELLNDTLDNIGDAWDEFATKQKLPSINKWWIEEIDDMIGINGESKPFKLKDPLSNNIPSLKLGFKEPGYVYFKMDKGILKIFPYIEFMPELHSNHRFLDGFLEMTLSDGGIRAYYGIKDRQWYTTVGHKRANYDRDFI